MKNIERFINNNKFFDERFYGDGELVLSLKEYPQYNLHIWEGYIDDILKEPKREGAYWSGFTRDFHELARTFSSDLVEIENLDEYINDLLLYEGREFELLCKDGYPNDAGTPDAYELILDFLTFAKENNLTVMAELY